MRTRSARHPNDARTWTARRSKLYVAGFACAALVLGAGLAFAALSGTAMDAPPATGSFAYNSFVPIGSYVDPVFGDAVRRLTKDHGHDDIYARNMWWSADETRYLHRTNGVAGKGDNWDVIDVATGTVTHTGIPFGSFAADGGFDPVNANVLYYLVQDRGDGRGEIHQVTLNAGGSWTDAVYFTAPAQIGELGGTLNWLDASGRYMLVRYGSEPSVHLYDRQNMGAGPYANPINASNSIDPGSYIGITPDGRYLVGYEGPPAGFGGMGQGVSWKLDHTNRAIASSRTIFWSLCGDHGSFLSASDGHNYMITYDCYSQAGLWRVDITNNAAGLNESQQQTLPNNMLLLAYPTWSDFGHVSTVARGSLKDWAFTSSEDGGDTFNSGTSDSSGNITPWHAYRQEIIAVNVLTGEIQRLAHHSSRSVGSDYYSQVRLSASWAGSFVGFPSNFDQPGGGSPLVDIYAVAFGTPAPPDPVLAVAKSGTGSGTVTSSPAGISCGATCSASYASGTAVTLTATAGSGSSFAGWSGACSGTGTCTVTLTGNISVTATFNTSTSATYTLTAAKSGTGGGTVTSSPAGISCGATCSASYPSGTAVTLTAAPASGSSFAGWSGACSGTGTCTITLKANTTVTATFNTSSSGGGTSSGAASPVTWTSLVNVTPTRNSLQKTSGCDGCADAGAASLQTIGWTGGYMQFTASESGTLRYIGLNRTNLGTGTGIRFSIRLQSGIAEVRESNTYRTDVPFAPGDVFRISVQSGVVKYYKNGVRFYTSSLLAGFPLLVDTSLENLGATISNVVLYRNP